MTDINGGPTMGELGRNIDSLSRQVDRLDGKVDALADLPSRVQSIERKMDTGATQRSAATWQGLYLFLAVLGSIASGVVAALIIGGLK